MKSARMQKKAGNNVMGMIRAAGLGYEYLRYEEEGQEPEKPYVVYLYPSTDNFAADGIVYQAINELDIELYTEKKDIEAEKKVEAVLKEHGFFYEKTETYLTSEKMFEVLYETEVLINE